MKKFVLAIFPFILIACNDRPEYSQVNSVPYKVHLATVKNMNETGQSEYSAFYDSRLQKIVIDKKGQVDKVIEKVSHFFNANASAVTFLDSKNRRNIYLFKSKELFTCGYLDKACELKATQNFTYIKMRNKLKILDFKGDSLIFDHSKVSDSGVSDFFAFVSGAESLLWSFNGRNVYVGYFSTINISDSFAYVDNKKNKNLFTKTKKLSLHKNKTVKISDRFATIMDSQKNSQLFNSDGKVLLKSFRREFQIFDHYAALDRFKRSLIFHSSSDQPKFNLLKNQKYRVNDQFLVVYSGKSFRVFNNDFEHVYKNNFNQMPDVSFLNDFLVLKSKKLKFSILHPTQRQVLFRYRNQLKGIKINDHYIDVEIENEKQTHKFNMFGDKI